LGANEITFCTNEVPGVQNGPIIGEHGYMKISSKIFLKPSCSGTDEQNVMLFSKHWGKEIQVCINEIPWM